MVFVDRKLNELKDVVIQKNTGQVTSHNVKSYVNLYANGGRTKLPQSTRLSRYTEHHFAAVK